MPSPNTQTDLISLKELGETIDWRGFRAYAWNIPQPRPGAYLFINLTNNKPYIGISQDVLRRTRDHSSGTTPRRLKSAFKSYGRGNFVVVPLVYWIIGTDGLAEFEASFIKEFDCIKNGYNVQEAVNSVGPYGSAFGLAVKAGFTDAGKARMSETGKAVYARGQLRTAADEFNRRPEQRERQSIRSTAFWADEEAKARAVAAMIAERNSPEGKSRVSATALQNWIKRRAKGNTKASQETKNKQSSSLRATWSDPVRRSRWLENRNHDHCSRRIVCLTDGKEFKSGAAAGRHYDCSQTGVSMCCRGKLYSLKGLVFRFVDGNGDIIQPTLPPITADSQPSLPLLPEPAD